jgi:Cys-rich protein (TIGR01571 family)
LRIRVAAMGATGEESTQPLVGEGEGEGQQSYGTIEHHGYPVVQSEPPPVINYYGGDYERGGDDWTTGLFGCLADVPNCVFTMFCPCLAFGRVAEHLDEGHTSCITAALVWYVIQQLTSCGCVYSYAYRRKLRSKYNLPSRPLPDWFIHYFCWFCAICQVLPKKNPPNVFTEKHCTVFLGFG